MPGKKDYGSAARLRRGGIGRAPAGQALPEAAEGARAPEVEDQASEDGVGDEGEGAVEVREPA